jgi:hypothetical protein
MVLPSTIIHSPLIPRPSDAPFLTQRQIYDNLSIRSLRSSALRTPKSW